MERRDTQRRATALAVAAVTAIGLTLGLGGGAAGAATGGCAGPVRNLQDQVNALVAPVKNDPSAANSKAAQELRPKLTALFATALQQHPECRDEIQQVALDAGASRADPSARAKGFLGPIGWLWNNIYYRVFQGNNVMMAVFGWELFLAPVILVLAGMAVLRGVGPAIRKPKVPDAIRLTG